MAQIICSKCGMYVSDERNVCPGCYTVVNKNNHDNSINSKETASSKGCFWLIAIILIIIFSIWAVSNKKPVKTTTYRKSVGSSSGYTSSYSNKTSSSYSSSDQTGNSGALAKAKSYLRSSAFSYKGLVNQLEYHGFSESEAKYGADNCGADWKDQALLKAKSYLRSSSFSYEGLIKQLEFEGFTSSEAKHGVDGCGANWNEQAVLSAKSYLRSISDWTRSELISQLEYEGFTSSQARYGVDNCGKNW